MSIIKEGTYFVVNSKGLRLTLAGGEEGTPVVALGEGAGGQEWKLTMRSDDNYVIENTKFNEDRLFLAPQELHVNALLVGKSEAFEWRIQQSSEENAYHIVVPGGPIGDSELAADLSLLRIYPPMTALRPLQVDNTDQAWVLVIKKDD